ncbi:hypothetical protein [Paenibacillus sp. NPDC058071]|uniref:hypothetical protein n=1 Tax=Paenibacillus sp. NPDC058071 TaxID=3346326 RepID=UPI0036DA1064
MTVKRTGQGKGIVKKSAAAKSTATKSTTAKATYCKPVFPKPFRKPVVCKPACHKKPVRKARKSAFAAVSGANQTLTDGVFAKVQYQVQQLDLNNEYNSATSTFRPKQSGVYSLVASVSFTTITMTPVTMDL